MAVGLITQVMNELNQSLRGYNKYATQTATAGEVQASSTNTEDNSSEVNSLGKDAFLQLLVTQLRYQDPLNPMDNTEFISQMAQFSSLEQMQNMNNNLEQFLRLESLSQGASLIGKEVEYIDQLTGQIVKADVEKISYEGGVVYACLDNEVRIEIDEIVSIS